MSIDGRRRPSGAPRATLHYGSSGTYLPVKEGSNAHGVRHLRQGNPSLPRRHPPRGRLPRPGRRRRRVPRPRRPSGCGKSTSLRMLAGLEEVKSGAIRIGERDVTDVPPKDRDIAMVFQNYALYPHMTVAENMGFALKIAGVGKEERAQRVQEAAKLLDLEQYLGRKPKALSGGQRQRVAMGRAIVRQPQVFLMDEPLSTSTPSSASRPAPDRLAPAPPRCHHGLRHARPDRGPSPWATASRCSRTASSSRSAPA